MDVKLKFLKKSTIDIIESYNADDDIVEETIETFEENECVECCLISESDLVYEVQFGDGTVSYIDKELVIVIEKYTVT
jgi:hydroxymethylpyrimidine pyrophosphatase-like HAD family hydrolase